MKSINFFMIALLFAGVSFALSPSDVILKSNSTPVLDLSGTDPSVFKDSAFSKENIYGGHYNFSETSGVEAQEAALALNDFVNGTGKAT